jgi:hypothetical protein
VNQGAESVSIPIDPITNRKVEDFKPVLLNILNAALAEVTAWRDDPEFEACYGYSEDNRKLPELLIKLIQETVPLLEATGVYVEDESQRAQLWERAQFYDGFGDSDYMLVDWNEVRRTIRGGFIEFIYSPSWPGDNDGAARKLHVERHYEAPQTPTEIEVHLRIDLRPCPAVMSTDPPKYGGDPPPWESAAPGPGA